MDLDRKNIKKIVLIVALAMLMLCAVLNIKVLLGWATDVFELIVPFLVGAAIAFALSVPMRAIERTLFARRGGRVAQKLRRPVSMLLTIVFVLAVLVLVSLIVAPEIGRTVTTLSSAIPGFLARVEAFSRSLMQQYPQIAEAIGDITLELDWKGLMQSAVSVLQQGAGVVFSTTVGFAGSLFSGAFDAIMSVIFALYLLAQKETLARQLHRVLYAYLPERPVDRFFYIMQKANQVFSGFVTGQCVEAVILGAIFFVLMTLIGMPYALMISVLIALTALIPLVGAFIGCIIGALLILMIDPWQAFWFVILFLIVQQLEGNLIYPRVVGASVGLPGIWVLVAVTIGGSLMGVAGMLLMVPTCSVLYALLREGTAARLDRRPIPSEKLYGVQGEVRPKRPHHKKIPPVSQSGSEPEDGAAK